MRRHPFLLFTLLAACAGEEGAAGTRGSAGQDGTSCVVTADGGVATIDCGDGGSSTLDPGSCTVASNGDGTHTITCPSGSTVVRDGEKLARGTIAGEAQPFGLPAAAGVEVTLVEQDLTVATDAGGRFAFEGLEPGIYRLHFSHEGYEPLAVENVMVFGDVVELGLHELKVAKNVASGMVMPLASPDGQWTALVRLDLYAETVDVSLLHMETGVVTHLMDDAVYADFHGERFFVFERYHGGNESELYVLDLQTGAGAGYGPYTNMWWTAGGYLLETSNGRIATVDLAAGTWETIADAAYIVEVNDDGRFALIGGALGYATVDLTSATIGTWFDPGWSSFSYESGRVFGVIDDGEDTLSWFHADPSTGAVERLETLTGPIPPFTLWARDGNVFLYGDENLVTVHDTVTGASTNVALAGGSSLSLSPDGSWLVSENSSGVRVEEIGGTAAHIIPEALPTWRGSQVITNDGTFFRVFDVELGQVVFERAGDFRWFWVSGPSDGLVALEGETYTVVNLDTGITIDVGAAEWDVIGEGSYIATSAEATSLITLHSLADGSPLETGLAGWAVELTPSGETLVVTSEGGELFAVSMADLSVLPLDEKVLHAELQGSALWYLSGEFDPGLVPVGYATGGDVFADIGLYWAVLP